MTSATRALDMKIWKLRERVDVQELEFVWCSTKDMQSDLCTKSLPTRQFRYLRDNLNGYALVMVYYPEIQMPEACIRRTELMEIIREYKAEEDAREARAKERKSKARM